MTARYCVKCGVVTGHRKGCCIACGTENVSERELEDAGQSTLMFPDTKETP